MGRTSVFVVYGQSCGQSDCRSFVTCLYHMSLQTEFKDNLVHADMNIVMKFLLALEKSCLFEKDCVHMSYVLISIYFM